MSDSTFISKLRASGLSAKDQNALIEALKADLASEETVRKSPPLLRQVIEASSGDHRYSRMAKVMASASSRFAVAPTDGLISVWDLRASERFKRLTPQQRMTEIAKLKSVGALRQEIEE
jgi:hypothetical protein